MVQIDFFDKDIVSTLVPISTIQPERVIFLIDKRNMSGKECENVERAIKEILPQTTVEYIGVAVDSLSEIYDALKTVVEGLDREEEVLIDLTGGTELMSACGYRIAKEYDILPIYVDVRREYVINADTGEIIHPVKHISLESCLTAIGAKRLKDSHDLPKREDFGNILAMSEIIFSNVVSWQELCQYIANTVSTSSNQMKVKLPEKVGKNQRAICRLVNGFMEYGFWKRLSNEGEIKGEYQFADKKAKSYMTTFGTWLELYIYIKALDVFDEAAMGVVIDWYEGDNIDTQDNEIDVIAMRRSIPIFISCKMRKPVSGDLYEVGFVASRLGGARAKALLATTYPVKEMGISPKRMFQRMKKFKVGLIEAERFKELPPADVFNQGIQMTD
ncbi:MAG: DUF1887 family protein [Firmicutes bacterium]|nr:DUF1887 family protein [Bacillota bacterium]